MSDCRLKLDVFEGPLDVLLYLIRRDEIDIYDIPIAHVTDQYIAFLDEAHTDNLDIAGEFLLMAATLIQIKARMLMPPADEFDEDDQLLDEIDPRTELVERLIEYRQFREIARRLQERESVEKDYFTRAAAVAEEEDERAPRAVGELNLYDLLAAFTNVLRYAEDEHVAELLPERVTLEQKLAETKTRLRESKSLRFADLFERGATRLDLVCTFLAVLELVRTGQARARQSEVYGEIRVYWTADR